ncbi:MAG: phosphoglycerate kinase [Alphaproteobacteria bacterium]|nr:phosphoglycerate kinase [Alphaproteobacteria bacterium]
MLNFHTLDDAQVKGKRVLVRLDLNLPLQNGVIADTTRLERSLPTLRELVLKGAKVIILSHLGRPQGVDKSFSLAPIAKALKDALSPIPVFFCTVSSGPQVEQAIQVLKDSEVLLLENIRFIPQEEENNLKFAQEIASWGDIYVNDAFSTAHRAHASTEGIAHILPSYAGRLMEEELKALNLALGNPKRPLMAIIGGAKISTKLPVLGNLISKVDALVIGGAMANTFLAAQGYGIGASLYEPDLLNTAHEILSKETNIFLPQDVVVAKALDKKATIKVRSIRDVEDEEMILDIGPSTCATIFEKMRMCHTLLWNGPLGVFETPPFDEGTSRLAHSAAKLTLEGSLLSVAGGGDTVAALAHANVLHDFSYVSTAGGAFLEWLEGKTLPGVAALLSENQS